MHGNSRTIFDIIDIYNSWSSQTYEGNRISHTIGIDNSSTASGVTIQSISSIDFSKVIGSGKDTILILSKSGCIDRIEELKNYNEDMKKLFAPISMVNIADWTGEQDRVAIALTRNGEILLFKNKQLVFAKRRGTWNYFPHAMLSKQITFASVGDVGKNIRESLYLTALDVAFSRSGGCLGLVEDKSKLKGIVNECDFLHTPEDKSKVCECANILCKKKKIYNIPRVIRAEMCAIDGALAVDVKGDILTTGAILQIKETSDSGGGRTAAAKTFGKYGVGIKISNAGYIDIYKVNTPDKLRFA